MAEREQTFLFADLAGFTALTEAHGDEQAADIAGDFSQAVEKLLPAGQAEAVKAIGDAVMIRAQSSGLAIDLGLRIVAEIGGGHGFPSVRVGMHTGQAVERDGDWFGGAVNTAARVSTLARGGEVLATEATCQAAGTLDGIELREHGRHELRNVVEPVLVFRAVAVGERAQAGLPIDPVCRMAVDPTHSAGTLVHQGVEYQFCSLECVQAFAAGLGDKRSDDGRPRLGIRPRLRRLLPLVQGGSYLGFGLWSLLGRDHYRATHGLKSDDWVLNAHGGWLSVVGTALVIAGLRNDTESLPVRTLGTGAALALALNDAALLRRISSIYRGDLVYEAALVSAWLGSTRSRRDGA